MSGPAIDYRCRHFLASKPCVFNKAEGAECPDCRHAAPVRDRLLFIKLDAIGDVLRSASLLPLIRARHPDAYLAWMTRPESVELVRMMAGVDEVITLDPLSLARLQTGGWDQVYSLSNDPGSASLAAAAGGRAPVVGFGLRGGVVHPSNAAAERWLRMAAFDRVKRENAASYPRLMADILEVGEAAIAPPVLVVPEPLRAAAAARLAALFGAAAGRPRVAVNIGSGARWPKKMIDAAQIAACCVLLRARLDAEVMLLGGAAEAAKMAQVAALCGADPRIRPLLTESSIPEFVALVAEADAMLCGDTLALHVASALQVPTVAVFGPTSQAEIDDFGGLVAKTWTPTLDCLCCYGDCDKTAHCMALLEPERLVGLVAGQLARAGGHRVPA